MGYDGFTLNSLNFIVILMGISCAPGFYPSRLIGQTGGLLLMRYRAEAASKAVLVDRQHRGKMMEKRRTIGRSSTKFDKSDPIC